MMVISLRITMILRGVPMRKQNERTDEKEGSRERKCDVDTLTFSRLENVARIIILDDRMSG